MLTLPSFTAFKVALSLLPLTAESFETTSLFPTLHLHDLTLLSSIPSTITVKFWPFAWLTKPLTFVPSALTFLILIPLESYNLLFRSLDKTFIVHLLYPCEDFAVISAFPGFNASTVPSLLTFAIESFEDIYEILLTDFATTVPVWPSVNVVGYFVMTTFLEVSGTVTLQVIVLDLQVAVIVAAP